MSLVWSKMRKMWFIKRYDVISIQKFWILENLLVLQCTQLDFKLIQFSITNKIARRGIFLLTRALIGNLSSLACPPCFIVEHASIVVASLRM